MSQHLSFVNYKSLKVEVTYKCNLKCELCPRQTIGNVPETEDMSIEKLEYVLNCFPNAEVVDFTGLGDITCYSHWKELVELCQKRNLKISFTTNGILLKDDFVKYLPEGSNVCVSINTENPRPEVRENLLNLKKLKNINLSVSTVVSKDSDLITLFGIVNFCAEIGATIVFVYARTFSKEDYLKFSPFTRPNIAEEISNVLYYAKSKGVNIGYYKTLFYPYRCPEPFSQMTIGLNGQIYPCGYVYINKDDKKDYKEIILGEEVVVPSENYCIGNIFSNSINIEKLETILRSCDKLVENEFYGLMYLMKNGDYSKGADYCKICGHRWGYSC